MGRRTRVFLSLYLGFAVYCLVVLLFGRTGIIATRELRSYHARLEANLIQLENVNAHLVQRLDSLRSNPETIRLEARQLGYLGPNEHFLEIGGYAPPPNVVTVGSLVTEKKLKATPDAVSRVIGFVAAAGAFVLFEVMARQRRGPKRS